MDKLEKEITTQAELIEFCQKLTQMFWDEKRVNVAAVNANFELKTKKLTRQRTQPQNRSIHLFCSMVADTLNGAGLDMKRTLKHDAEIPWSDDRAKEFLWRPVQIAMFNIESTTELNTAQVSEVHKVVMRHLQQSHGLPYVPFPSYS